MPYPLHAKALLSFSRKFGHLVIWSFGHLVILPFFMLDYLVLSLI